MKRFFLNILLLGFFVFATLYLYDVVIHKVNDSYTKEIQLISKAKIISLGSSSGLRLKWGAKKPDEISNLCMNGADLFSEVEVLNAIADHLSPSQLVFLEVNSFKMYQISTRIYDTSRVYKLNLQTASFYNDLPLSFIDNKLLWKYICSKAIAVNGVINFEGAFNVMFKKVLPFSIYEKLDRNSLKNEEWLIHERGSFDKMAKIQKKDIIDATNDCKGIREKTLEAMQKVKNIADEYHITLIAYSCPRHQIYLKTLGKAMLEPTDSLLSMSLKKCNIPYFDNSSDKDFVNDYSSFYDCIHLNKIGAQKFDDKLFKEVSLAFPQYSEFFKGMIR